MSHRGLAAMLAAAAGLAWLSPATAQCGYGPSDQVVRRAPIPSARRRHGEVRLVRRPGGVAVQTLLFSASLRRGVHEIMQLERRHWPAGDPGHADSEQYLALLEQARDEVMRAFEGREDRAEDRQRLMIETALCGQVGRVAAYEVDVQETDEALLVTGASQLVAADVSAAYAAAAMEIILQNAFGDASPTVQDALALPAPEPIPTARPAEPDPSTESTLPHASL